MLRPYQSSLPVLDSKRHRSTTTKTAKRCPRLRSQSPTPRPPIAHTHPNLHLCQPKTSRKSGRSARRGTKRSSRTCFVRKERSEADEGEGDGFDLRNPARSDPLKVHGQGNGWQKGCGARSKGAVAWDGKGRGMGRELHGRARRREQGNVQMEKRKRTSVTDEVRPSSTLRTSARQQDKSTASETQESI